MKPTILVLEDDLGTRVEVCEALEEEGFTILSASTRAELLNLIKNHPVDLFLLDLMLPDGSGLTLAKEIRHQSNVGIIIVTGKADPTDRVVGLEIGADDYVIKPFNPRELVARIRSVLRRTQGHVYHYDAPDSKTNTCLQFHGWRIDLSAHGLLSPDGDPITLTSVEFALLRAFVESPNRVLSREQLLNHIHERSWYGDERAIDGLVSRLRKKIPASKDKPEFIRTVRGSGYLFTAKVAAI